MPFVDISCFKSLLFISLTMSLFLCATVVSAQEAIENDLKWEADWQAAKTAAEKQDFASAVNHATKAINNGLSIPQVYYHRGCWNFRNGKARE